MILSPEEGHRLDLRQHTRGLLAAMEADLGTRLEWVAIDHHNTAHAHVHVAIRGRDEEGRTLAIPRDYVREGIRARSQELATRRLGYRTPQDRERARERAIDTPYFGELDALLERRAGAERGISFEGPLPSQVSAQTLRLQLIGRLKFLESLGLAEQTGTRTWRLSELHRPGLRQIQLMRDVQKSVARGDVMLTDPGAAQAVVHLGPGESVRGRVAGTTFGDVEERIFLVIEASDGRALLLPESAEMERLRTAGGLQRGTVVTLVGRESQGQESVGKRTEVFEHGRFEELEQATEVGNVLDVAVLERATSQAPDPPGGLTRRGFDFRWETALARRAEALERAGLLERRGLGQWHAAPGALEKARTRMQLRDRLPIAFSEVQRIFGKPVRVVPTLTFGMVYKGRLVAYGEDEAGERFALIEADRAIQALPTERRDLALGTNVRARLLTTTYQAEASEQERRRGLMWQLADLELERDRERGR